jgi:hypothetical protein
MFDARRVEEEEEEVEEAEFACSESGTVLRLVGR